MKFFLHKTSLQRQLSTSYRLKAQSKQARKLKCEFCELQFDSNWALRDHLIVQFALDTQVLDFLDQDLGIKEAQDLVSQDFQASEEDSGLVQCQICNLPFKGNKGLKQHIAKVHSETFKSVKCELCGKFFRHKYALKFHCRQVHEKATRVKCKICKKPVYNKYMLPLHMKRYHPE